MPLMPVRRAAGLLAAALLLAAPARAELKRLTIDDIYDPDKKADFTGTPPANLVWIDDGHYLWPKTLGEGKGKTTEYFRVEAGTGKTERLFDPARLEAVLARLPGVKPEEARTLARQPSYAMNPGRTALVLAVADDLYRYDFGSDAATRLTSAAGKEEEPAFSPDGTAVAFVRGGNLFVVGADGRGERGLTSDGGPDVSNGKLDWIYQEEVYGRGLFRAHWWSPDSKSLAFLRLDEKDVPRYTLVDDVAEPIRVEVGPYPRAGEPNPSARLGIARTTGGPVTWMDASRFPPDLLIVDVAWRPDGAQVLAQVQDREQTWLELVGVSPADGQARTLIREQGKAWVDRAENVRFLKDGSFLWPSERTGWQHLYHYRADGTLVGALTSGPWEVRTLHGVDEAGGWVYFSGTERSPIGGDVYRARLDGSGRVRLSTAPGTHVATFNPAFTLYVDSWSDAQTPTQVRLHRADGTVVRVIDENRLPALAAYRLSKPEFLQVRTRDGFVMEAVMIKPPDFDPSRRYPVYEHIYGGPHAPQVKNAWYGTTGMFHQLLADHGVIVWILDNRTASGKGAESVWPAYQHFGPLELQDVEDGISYLKAQPWVDPARIGINGWSYGGFMVTYALTHSRNFAMGIAGGPVTDWRHYDSIYTERYMKTPAHNPDGYAATSPLAAARDLHGKLLLIHGAIDDNVHPQNTLRFASELQKAGHPFRLMLYPKSRHGIVDPLQVKHLHAMMLAFVEETLLTPGR
jgi:dipeptidyl-peptidase-4